MCGEGTFLWHRSATTVASSVASINSRSENCSSSAARADLTMADKTLRREASHSSECNHKGLHMTSLCCLYDVYRESTLVWHHSAQKAASSVVSLNKHSETCSSSAAIADLMMTDKTLRGEASHSSECDHKGYGTSPCDLSEIWMFKA